ncbi:heme ABC transporter permease [Acetobacteraceae bacterium]|nr:heme ABC transporter permease [Acetobacteraceae bacterium]
MPKASRSSFSNSQGKVQSYFHYFGNPTRLRKFLSFFLNYLGWAALLFLLIGLFLVSFYAPQDWQQGAVFKLIYLHVPLAWLSCSFYLLLSFFCLLFLVWKNPLAGLLASQTAPVGLIASALCLITGALWGRPTWGTWWVWDARLTSVLILFFLYLGFIALQKSYKNNPEGMRLCALLGLVGAVDLPIIHFSVQWWSTLHQGPTFRLGHMPPMPMQMWLPLLFTFLGFSLGGLWLILAKTYTALRARQLKGLLETETPHSSAYTIGNIP